jgi:Zn finger protein HypA/HybF involved in hydrogenase expression
LNCPGCGAGMMTLDFERKDSGRVQLDFCFPCQVIWFDAFESQQLTPRGVLEVFTALHENRAATRNPLTALVVCPRCHGRLELTHDLQHATKFTYYRCPFGHGRLTPFFQFLLEKNFVRPITGAELAELKAKVRTVQCSNCGAPLDLEHEAACKYCGSPISILDPDAVTKTVRELATAEQRLQQIDVGTLADALTVRLPPGSSDSSPFLTGLGGSTLDLVGVGIAIVAGVLLRS